MNRPTITSFSLPIDALAEVYKRLDLKDVAALWKIFKEGRVTDSVQQKQLLLLLTLSIGFTYTEVSKLIQSPWFFF